MSTEVTNPDAKVKSVFFFAIAPVIRGKGVATLLLECVCHDPVVESFD